jgi:hypothetical protein
LSRTKAFSTVMVVLAAMGFRIFALAPNLAPFRSFFLVRPEERTNLEILRFCALQGAVAR